MSSAVHEPSPTKEYVGGCHCKKFRYIFTHPVFDGGEHDVLSCNCSICLMHGLLIVIASKESFQFTSGSFNELTAYEFHTKKYKHHFCPTCGTEVIIVAQDGFGINVRGVDGVDVDRLKLKILDGKKY